jgi:hypothetical protein
MKSLEQFNKGLSIVYCTPPVSVSLCHLAYQMVHVNILSQKRKCVYAKKEQYKRDMFHLFHGNIMKDGNDIHL